jgi:spermidine synthase
MSPDRAPSNLAGRALLVLAFFLSGAAALAYEVSWSRALLLVLGSTATTSAIVLGTFVGALGLGARWGGRCAERSRRPLRLYGLLEIGAATWALVAVPVAGLLETPYVALAAGAPAAVRLALRVLAAAVVIVPASWLLGATLPVLVRHAVRVEGETGRQTAWLYGVNTAGAVLGCLFTGFVGVAAWGVTGMVTRAALLAMAVGLLAALAGRACPPLEHAERRATMRVRRPAGRPALRTALLCGFLGLGVEVVGLRLLVFFLEGFTVTFAAMLGVFVAGLGVGSLLLGPRLARSRRPARALGILLLACAGALLLDLEWVVPSLEGWMHAIRRGAYEHAASQADIAAGLRLSALLGAAALFFLPALLLGPTFPLCVRWAELDGDPPGHAVGRVYLWNSAGCLLAPLLFTFVLVPWFEVPGAWFLALCLAAAAGLALLLHREEHGAPVARRDLAPLLQRLAPVLGLALGVAVLWAGPPGTRAADLVRASVVMRGRPGRRLIQVCTDDVTTASAVEGAGGDRTLYTDDFAAAATGRHYRYMRLLGHLPAVLAKDPRHAMVIAFGTGTTAGAVARHEEVKRLELVEVSSAVLELADYFLKANHAVLRDPRARVIHDDGRNALLLHAPDLDLITLEPLMPYAPAGYPFYTREFYRLARDRLREGGVLCQWLPVHAMPVGLYVAFLHAFFDVFPDGSLWFFEQSTALIGRKGHAQPDARTVLERLTSVSDDLREAGMAQPWLALSGYLASGREVLATKPPPGYARYAHRPLADLDPYPEFQPTPRAPLNTPFLHQTLAWLLTVAQGAKPPTQARWWGAGEGAEAFAGERLALAARLEQAQADYLALGLRGLPPDSPQRAARQETLLQSLAQAAEAYHQARAKLPGDRVLAWRELKVLRDRADLQVRRALAAAAVLHARGDDPRRAQVLRLAAERLGAVLPPRSADPDPQATGRAEAALLQAAVLLRLGRCAPAEEVLSQAHADVDDPVRRRQLAAARDAVRRLRAGGEAGPLPDSVAWVLAGHAACRPEGAAAVQAELDALRAALAHDDMRAWRLAARRLAAAADREAVDLPVAEALRAPSPGPGGAGREALLAALRRRLDPKDDALSALLSDASKPGFAAALAEAGRWGLARRFPQALEAAAASPSVAVRRALAAAAAQSGDVALLRPLARLLGDADPEVTRDAWSVFLKYRASLVKGFDPQAPQAKRAAFAARLAPLLH